MIDPFVSDPVEGLTLNEDEKSALALAERFGLSVKTKLLDAPFVAKGVHILSYDFAKEHGILPLDERGDKLVVAISDPLNLEAITFAQEKLGKELLQVFSTRSLLDKALEKCYHQKAEAASQFIEGLKQEEGTTSSSTEEGYDLLADHGVSPVIRLLNVILTEAIQEGASDIHFEPMEEGLDVRYRIDGALQFRHAPPQELQAQLITRIKVLSQLDIAEHRLPQDGRIKLSIGGRQIDFRVSTVPVVFGERVVLRILDKSLLGLEQLGMPGSTLEELKKYISQNQGIVLVTGPTGSGKTSTLYSALSHINGVQVNVMTVEDPVEYKLPGMAQISVNQKIGLTFAAGLRHILRQDPDVIMIGEIRDKETAEIAIQASLTGHLVLSTLHTNDAPSALTRLVEMGVQPYLLSSSVLAVLAQRLVRTICPDCKVAYKPSLEEWEAIGRKQKADVLFYRGEGCEGCRGSGYRGRQGIYELMPLTPAIKKAINQTADATALRSLALSEEMESLRSSGSALVLSGETTVSEVIRVTKEENV